MATQFPTTGTQQGDINAGLISAGGVYTPTAITPDALKTAQPFPLATPPALATYPVSTLGTTPTPTTPALTPTPQESKASGLTATLQSLYSSLTGKSADQTSANTAAGVDTIQHSINDLTAQLTGLKNEAAAIPLQFQQKAQNGTITTGGLNSEQNQALLTNSIAALGVSTLLAASQGQLANAQALADKTVAAKYDPIQAQIDATSKNLQLILNDPETSLEDKNRAQAQLDIQNQNKDQVAAQKQNATDIWKVATDAASNGTNFKPNATYKTLSTALTAISKAATPSDALKIAADVGLTVTPKSVTSTTPTGTEGERQAQALSQYGAVFIPGSTYNGTKILGTDGFMDPKVWQQAISDATSTKANSLTRADFIKQFGYLLNPKDYASYGLTPTELKLITG